MDPAQVPDLVREWYESSFLCNNYPHKSDSAPSTCKAACETCVGHFRSSFMQEIAPYTAKLADDQAAQAIRASIESTMANIAHLKKSIDEHGNSIQKRWRKRSVKQRAAILAARAPCLHQHRWADAPGTKDYVKRITGSERDGLYTPFLSHELLVHDSSRFLCLLHARITHSPEDWIFHDMMAQCYVWEKRSMPLSYNPHCVDINAGEEFGKLVPWDKDRAHRWDIVGFPRAQAAFEGQAQISRVLVDITAGLLGNLEGAAHGRDVWDAAAERGFQGAPIITQALFWDAPSIAPPRFDTSLIRELLLTACDAVRDESRTLQTDWHHLRYVLAKLHNSTYCQSLRPMERYQYLADTLLRIPRRLDDLVMTRNQAIILTDVLDASKHLVQAGEPLPDEYAIALQALDKLLSLYLPHIELKQMMARSSAFQ